MTSTNYEAIASVFVDLYITSGAEAAALYVMGQVDEEHRSELYPYVEKAFDKRGYDLS